MTFFAGARMALRACAAAVLMVLALVQAGVAASVTINETVLDAIFSQASFGTNTIDVRIAATQTLVAPAYTDIDSAADSYGLLNSARTGPQIDMFFVDSVSACGDQVSASIVGCGWINRGGVYLESAWAAGSYGAELQAHEVAHNLGLLHSNGGLMNAFLNGDVTLSAAQVATILGSALVQRDASGLFIEIVPWLVDGITTVPVPASGVMLIAGLGALSAMRRRRRMPRA